MAVADTNRVEADFAEAVRCVASSLDNRGLITAEAACQNAASSLRVLANGIDQLRQRLGEVEAANTANKAGFEEYERRYYLEVNAREDAEAKLALAEQLLREESPMIDDYSNVLHSEYSDHEKSEAAGALSDRIDAAIDASGEGHE